MDFGNVADKENINALMEQVQHLSDKNVQLQDRNERLYAGFGDLQERMGGLTGSKPDLSPRTLFSEEEKLKISKELVDLQIDTNKMKEQYETEKFELKNMILALENRVLELELRSEKVSGERDALRDRLHTLESSRKELADEYIILKSNYLALGKELDQEVLKNEELSLELLSLTNARSAESNHHHSATEPAAEPDRVQASVHRPPAQKVKVRLSLPCSQSELSGEQGSNTYLILPLPKTARRRGCP
ncbi:CCD78 protein, partial [Odontophorus gujanensis]|nr:CCD78 protein [Odontophorus gujanensis]